MVGGVDREGGLAWEVDMPAACLPARFWFLATPLQDLQNGLGPEVLMDVDRAHWRAL
jgi:hypothetical protein